MIGSVFSPYYAAARRRNAPDPEHYSALNVVLYGSNKKRWALTERGRNAVVRDESNLTIGPSRLRWRRGVLELHIDEITVPWPSRLVGTIRLMPGHLNEIDYSLDAGARHKWWPIAPRSRIEVEFSNPDERWSGDAYLDSNFGSEPLENRFEHWDWSRSMLRDGDCAVLYDTALRDHSRRNLALRFHRTGEVSTFTAPAPSNLPATNIWRIARCIQGDPDRDIRVEKSLEDTPFYARSRISLGVLGEPVEAMHESLSLDRFRRGWVRGLLPFRMPRNPWSTARPAGPD